MWKAFAIELLTIFFVRPMPGNFPGNARRENFDGPSVRLSGWVKSGENLMEMELILKNIFWRKSGKSRFPLKQKKQ